jgi:hypothetical protein
MSIGVIAAHDVIGGASGPTWLNHVVIKQATSQGTVDPSNPTLGGGSLVAGTAFTPTAGRLLVALVAGAVTTSTPTGWTLPSGGSSVNSQGLYVFNKTAAGSDTLTGYSHNAAWEAVWDIYEFDSSVTFAGAGGNGRTSSGSSRTLSGMSGTNTVFTAVVGTNLVGTWTYSGGATAQVDTNNASYFYHYGIATVSSSAASVSIAATLEDHEQVMFSVK